MSTRWTPKVTVAAIIHRDGRFLMVEERDGSALVLNQPAGHLEHGETLIDAVIRETREETAHAFVPAALVGIYLYAQAEAPTPTTYLRFAFTGAAEPVAGLALDPAIARTLWLTPAEIDARRAAHRSPLVARAIDDFFRGQRFDLGALQAVGASTTTGTAKRDV